MKEEISYQWRCLWIGKWITTRHHSTEESIRKEHPEAVPILSSKITRTVPSTHEECLQAMVNNSTGGVSRPMMGSDGSLLMVWEEGKQ